MTDSQDAPLVFVDELPATGAGRPLHGKWLGLVGQLQESPGKWAVIQVAPADKGSRLNSGQKALKKLGAQATTRTEDGESTLYARWPTPEQVAEADKAEAIRMAAKAAQ